MRPKQRLPAPRLHPCVPSPAPSTHPKTTAAAVEVAKAHASSRQPVLPVHLWVVRTCSPMHAKPRTGPHDVGQLAKAQGPQHMRLHHLVQQLHAPCLQSAVRAGIHTQLCKVGEDGSQVDVVDGGGIQVRGSLGLLCCRACNAWAQGEICLGVCTVDWGSHFMVQVLMDRGSALRCLMACMRWRADMHFGMMCACAVGDAALLKSFHPFLTLPVCSAQATSMLAERSSS
eukprot:1159183-Pelagomonas_calceolata.AAC.5